MATSFPFGTPAARGPFDITDILSDNLINLDIFSDPKGEDSPRFHMFPMLPTELRLKIFSHTFPRSSCLRLKVDVVISDPSFGLYLSFNHQYGYEETTSIFFVRPKEEPVRGTRMLSLLGTNKESREHYLSHYSIALPASPPSRSTIRISPLETVYLTNFNPLMQQEALKRAINCEKQYRLQDCLGKLERVAISVSCFMGQDIKPTNLIRLFGNLKCVKAVMWPGFVDMIDPLAKAGVRRSMESVLTRVEDELRRDENLFDVAFRVPKIEFCQNQGDLEEF